MVVEQRLRRELARSPPASSSRLARDPFCAAVLVSTLFALAFSSAARGFLVDVGKRHPIVRLNRESKWASRGVLTSAIKTVSLQLLARVAST